MFSTAPRLSHALIAAFALCWSSASTAQEVSELECSLELPGNCLDGVSAGVTGGDNLRTVATQIGERAQPGEGPVEGDQASLWQNGRSWNKVGLAAGDGPTPWAVWGSFGYSEFEGTPVFGAAVTRFDAELVNILIGADVALSDNFIVGGVVGIERSDADTAFNAGKIEGEGFTLAPYALVILSDYFSVDAAFGWSTVDTDQQRIDPADSAAGRPVFLRSSFESSRWFAAANLNAFYSTGNWRFGGQLGVLKTEEEQDAFAESGGSSARNIREREITLSQGHVSIDAGYAFGKWEPYGRIGYYRDFSRDDGQNVGGLPGASVRTQFDDDAWRFAAGMRYYGDGVSGGIEVETEEGRDDFESTSVTVSVRADF